MFCRIWPSRCRRHFYSRPLHSLPRLRNIHNSSYWSHLRHGARIVFLFNFSVWTKNVLTTFSSISIIDPFSLTPTFASQPGSTTPPHLHHGFCFCKSLRYFTRSDSRGPGGLHEGGRQQAQDLPPVRPDKHGTRQVGQHWRNDIPQMYREQLLGLKGCKKSCQTRSCNMNVIWKTALNVES